MMDDWVVSNYVDPLQGGQIWVYYENPSFQGIHFSASVDVPSRDHMAMDGLYYFGRSRTFNGITDPGSEQVLKAAWADRFAVQ